MAASSASDIPESKSDYCPCNRCTVARKQGMQEVIRRVRELHKPYLAISGQTVCKECWDGEYNKDNFPCETIKALDGEQ